MSNKTIEQLEDDYWGNPPKDATNLILKCFELRKKQLQDLTTEDLRFLIGQNIALQHLLPLALEILNTNIFAEGDLYEGDLLQNVLNSDKEFWRTNKKLKSETMKLIDANKHELENHHESIGKQLLKEYDEFCNE